jgi:methionyl-tRNA synthetase
LSTFRDSLLEFYEQNPDWIVPARRMTSVIRAVEEGLSDLSVSRPSSRLTWGVPVPDDSTQTIYVWLDALMNYAVQAGYPWSPDRPTSGGWPADVQVIGKDIVR